MDKDKKPFNWAVEQESFMRGKIGKVFDALDAVEKSGGLPPVKPRNPGYVWLDKAFFPFTAYERTPEGIKVQVPRLKCERKTGKYSMHVKKYVVAQEQIHDQIKWRPGFEGNNIQEQ